MVKTDVGYHAQHRSHYVGAVQTASQSGLKNHDIDFLIGKPVQSHKCRYLKEGHVEMVEGLLPLTDKSPYIFFGHKFI